MGPKVLPASSPSTPLAPPTLKIGRSYTLAAFLAWTSRKTYILLLRAAVPATLYPVFG